MTEGERHGARQARRSGLTSQQPDFGALEPPSEIDRRVLAQARRPGPASPPDFETLEPPPEIDRLVLARARQAIESVPRPGPYRSISRAMPVALAATLVLAVGMMGVQQWQPGNNTSAPAEPVQAASLADAETAADGAAAGDVSEPLYASRPGAHSADPVIIRRLVPRPELSRPAVRHILPDAAVPASAERAGTASGTDSASPRDAHGEGPGAWLRRIEQLRAQGQTEAAEREWREFRKVYPDYPVRGSEGPTK